MRQLFLLAFLLFVTPALATEVAPLTGGNVTDLAVTIGTASTSILASDNGRQFLSIQNVTAGTNNLACTYDGSTPAIGGNGDQLAGVSSGAGGSSTFDTFVPRGAVNCIGSAASTAIHVKYTP